MPKIPRDLSGSDFSKVLLSYGFEITRQNGQPYTPDEQTYRCGISYNYSEPLSLKIGTLNNILKDIADYLKCDRESLMQRLFRK